MWTGSVEADHRIFHAADRTVDRDGDRVRVGEGELRKDVQRVDDGGGGVAFPQRVALFGVVTHGQRFLPIHGVALGVPDEFTGVGETEIANVVGVIDPGLFAFGLVLFVGGGFCFGDDFQRLFRRDGRAVRR